MNCWCGRTPSGKLISMNLFDALPSVIRLSAAPSSQPVSITFTPALPPEVRTQIATQNPAQPFTLTVSSVAGNKLTFTSPVGETFTAIVNPALPQGTQLQLSIASQVPIPSATPQAATASLVLQAKILPSPTPLAQNSSPQLPPALPASNLPAALPAAMPATPLLTLSLPAAATSGPILKNIITTSLLQATAPSVSAKQSAPLPVPAGPVAVVSPTTLPSTITGLNLTLKPTAPLQPDGTQKAVLTPSTPTPSRPPLPITLNLGVALPINTPQPAIVLPAANPAEPPVLVLTGQSPVLPETAAPTLKLQPASLPAPQSPAAAIPSTPAPEIPIPALPVSGRILPPAPSQPEGTQTVLLATGTTAVLKSPQPLPTGSIIVADLPITPTTALQRVLMADSQSQPQPNTSQQAQFAAPVTPQTTQAVMAPGMVIQGTITGQNEQGSPLLTITQPGALSGLVVPLTLTDTTTILPVGAQLNIRVEDNLAVTILGLTLPPQTQAAYTLGTIGARWEGLQQALQVLQQQAPIQAANLRASLPQLSNLLPGLIAFTNALRTNRMDEAFDTEATRLLKSMGIDLSSDISQLSQLQQRPSAQTEAQWRGTLFPYVEAPGEDPRQGGFFWRREKSDHPRSPTSTRFVVEVEMSRMGALQLDGLITYPDIWLKLRRTSVPEEGFTEGLQSLVKSLLAEYGLNGGISVETTAHFPVNPRSELLGQTENPLPTSA